MRLKLIRFLLILALILTYFSLCSLAYEPKVSGGISKKQLIENKQNKTEGETKDINEEQYLAKLDIPKINISNYLYPLDSKENTVDKNIEVLKDSDMPDISNGNFILAAHNGLSKIAYFHNLDKLEIGDEVQIKYNNKKYTYIISKIYDVLKTGQIAIKRDKNKKTITLITCKGEAKQLVVIGYLK